MPERDQHASGLLAGFGRLARTGLGAIENRVELFALEWEEERVRLMGTLVWAAALVLLAVLVVILLTATIIFLFRPDVRIYVTIGFTIFYFIGAVIAALGLRRVVRRDPFPESIGQIKKDRAWLESMK